MKKVLKTIGWILLIGIIGIQFFRPAKNMAAGDQPFAIAKAFTVPADVKTILDKACMDCHSNNSRYPWYYNIQPVAWWMANHVKEGKGKLNLDEYTNKRLRFQYHKMEEVIEMVEDKKMPIDSYTWTHNDAKLTVEERTKITDWAKSIMDTLEARYPIDSLKRKPEVK